MKITVSVTNDLVTDHRVHKVCTTLTQSGYKVKLVGRKFRSSPPLQRIYQTDRLRLFFNRSVLFYAEYNIRLFFYLLFDKTDLYLSNDTDSLPANYLASRIRRKPLVFDAHEMFPEVPEVTNRKFVKKVWTKLEDWIFPHLKHCYTVCRSIADYYNIRYKINMGVVRNIPPACKYEDAKTQDLSLATAERCFPRKRESQVKTQELSWDSRLRGKQRSAVANDRAQQFEIPSHSQKIILYQGAVNIGRGIEWVIDAMPYLEDCIFYIAGDGDVMPEMQAKVKSLGLEDKVLFLGRIPLEALPVYTSQVALGLVLLENRGLNYYYALPNRIFDFMRAHVPVLATDFPEMRRIVATYHTGVLIDHYEPEYLAEIIRNILATPINHSDFEHACRDLSWERESEVILKIMENL